MDRKSGDKEELNMEQLEAALNKKLEADEKEPSENELTEEEVEAWLDTHEEFVKTYFASKANKFLLDSILRGKIRSSRQPSRCSSPTSMQPSTGFQTPMRKSSSSLDFDKGFLKPIGLEGSSYFSSQFDNRIVTPRRQRKSKEELQELKVLDEHGLLMELVQDIANDLDIPTLCHKILQNVSILTDGDRCSIFLVTEYGNEKYLVSSVYDVNADSTIEEQSEKEDIKVPWGVGIVGFTAQSGESVNIKDAYKDSRFNQDIDKKTGFKTTSILCMPVKNSEGEVIAVAQVINKTSTTEQQFTADDEQIFAKYLVFCGLGITNAQLFAQSRLESKRNLVLLDLARVIFEEQSSLHNTVHKIMMNTQSLLQCERCSVLLVDASSKGLFSQAFDLEAQEFLDEEGKVGRKQSCISTEVHFPINIGITGYVATTGETLNIPDAYNDPRFDPSVDEGCGFKTRTVLCMPIKNSKGEIIGVVQLLNKMDGLPFNQNDENLFEAFAIFCGMAIHNTTIFEECAQARARQKIALDVLSYHATASESEAQQMTTEIVPSSKTFKLREFTFDDAVLSDKETVLAVLRMFQDLRLITRFRLDYQVLCNWVLTVKKNYRNVIYHNWRHAFNVTQMMFLMLKEVVEMKRNFTDEEKLALLVGCMCHDLDHRGTTNTFQIKSESPLAELYGTSVMEHHHFDHCIMILHSSGNELFNTLTTDEYNVCIGHLEHAILSTDLALYFKKRTGYFKLVEEQAFNWNDDSQRSMIRSMMMSACDLSATCKPWPVQQRVAHLIAEEFFQQGDLEQKTMHQTPIEMMDRAKKDKLPKMQVGFIESVCLPIYKNFSEHFEHLKPLADMCANNKWHWKQLDEEFERRTADAAAEKNDDDEAMAT